MSEVETIFVPQQLISTDTHHELFTSQTVPPCWALCFIPSQEKSLTVVSSRAVKGKCRGPNEKSIWWAVCLALEVRRSSEGSSAARHFLVPELDQYDGGFNCQETSQCLQATKMFGDYLDVEVSSVPTHFSNHLWERVRERARARERERRTKNCNWFPKLMRQCLLLPFMPRDLCSATVCTIWQITT